jgi:hypothetical protein
MNAFKFPDKMDVFLSCELELCKGNTSPPTIVQKTRSP